MSANFSPKMTQDLSFIDAKKMIQAYHCHPLRFKTPVTDESGTKDHVLRGLLLSEEDMDAVINLKTIGAKSYMLLFAISHEDVCGDPVKPPIEQDFTTIIAGIDQHGEIMTGSGQLQNKFSPCPSSCNPVVRNSYRRQFIADLPNECKLP